MKNIRIFPLLLFTTTVYGQVYRCESEAGKINYQDTECRGNRKQSELTITTFDENKIREAQGKLAKALETREKLENSRAEAKNRERELRALEQIGRAKKDMANAISNQTNAINRNTDAAQNKSFGYRPYYYKRSKVRPIRHPEKKKEKSARHQ